MFQVSEFKLVPYKINVSSFSFKWFQMGMSSKIWINGKDYLTSSRRPKILQNCRKWRVGVSTALLVQGMILSQLPWADQGVRVCQCGRKLPPTSYIRKPISGNIIQLLKLDINHQNHKGQAICLSSPTTFHCLPLRGKSRTSLCSGLWSYPGSLKNLVKKDTQC